MQTRGVMHVRSVDIPADVGALAMLACIRSDVHSQHREAENSGNMAPDTGLMVLGRTGGCVPGAASTTAVTAPPQTFLEQASRRSLENTALKSAPSGG
eukprot:3451049-Pyramimonas_sp.AAC.1